MANAILQTHSALLSAIFEHSGHLHSYLQNTDISFKDCCKLILLLFSTNQYPHLQKDIETSSQIHFHNIHTGTPPNLTKCEWVSQISKQEYNKLFTNLSQQWDKWKPTSKFAIICKESIDDILPN